MYDASLGQFLERDPLGYGTGDANLYLYVRDSPMDLTDAYGLVCCCAKFPESCKIEYTLHDSNHVGKIVRERGKATAKVASEIWVIVTVVSTKGMTCGCHIAQAALTTTSFNKEIPRWHNPPRGFPRNDFPVAFPVFTKTSETYINFRDYNGTETKCDDNGNAYITDSPGFTGTPGLGDVLPTYYLFVGVNWVIEAPSVLGAYFDKSTWDWSNGVSMKWTTGSSDKALDKSGSSKNK